MNAVMKTVISAVLLSATIGAASAATEVQSLDGHKKIGSVSVSGLSTIDDASKALSEKARQSGAPYYKITSMGGHNKIYATADLLE